MKTRIFLLSILTIIYSCSDFLDERSDSKLAIPSKLEDNQALLDRSVNVLGNTSFSIELSADDLQISDASFNAVSEETEKRLYTWQPDNVMKAAGNDWARCYSRINVCNTVIHNLSVYNIENSDNVKGQALAIRAMNFLEAAQVWCLAYDKNTADKDLGIPLRLSPDINEVSVRSSLKQTYEQILSDLNEAVPLLPDLPLAMTRPSKASTYALLARTYLYMGDYENALIYGNKSLSLYNKLLDYNALNASESYPLKDMNIEVLLRANINSAEMLSSSKRRVSQELYNLYDTNDLRKSLFFKKESNGEISFRGGYSGSSELRSSLTTDEVYLIVSEANAYSGNLDKALSILNELLIKRWKKGTYISKVAGSKDEALHLIRQERRKELIFRGTRWSDLKRYNREGGAIVLKRTVNGQIVELPPNDLKYAIAIPEDIITLTGMQQNIR